MKESMEEKDTGRCGTWTEEGSGRESGVITGVTDVLEQVN